MVKDIKLFEYIRSDCPQAKFIFKGDDDILLVPENFYEHIRDLEDTGDPYRQGGTTGNSIFSIICKNKIKITF